MRKEQEVKQKKNFDVSWTKIGETSSGDRVNWGAACSIADQGMYMNTVGMDNRYKNSMHSTPSKQIASKTMALDAADHDLDNIYCSIEDVRTMEKNKPHTNAVIMMPSVQKCFKGQL
jgi:hypothetical protein